MEDVSLLVSIFRLLVAFGIFALLVYVSKFIVNKVKSSRFKNSRFLNPIKTSFKKSAEDNSLIVYSRS